MKNKELPKVAILSKCIIKSDTIGKVRCKQYFVLVVSEGTPEEPALIVEKYLLSDRNDNFSHDGFVMLRVFRGKYLYRQIFGVKIDTLFKAYEKLLDNPKRPTP